MFELGKRDHARATRDQGSQRSGGSTTSAGSSRTSAGTVAVIGRSIKIDGDLRGDEDLLIEGDVTGTIQLPNHSLTIGSEGRIKADIYAKSVTVDGEMNGDLYGSECVSIRKNARMLGNVVATRVSIEDGARFKGSIDMDPKSVEAALGEKRAAQASAADAGRGNGAKQISASAQNSKPANSVAQDKSATDPAH